ncbi:MAG TPA: extracellular solute-binding protein, partial [Bordetella sp.]
TLATNLVYRKDKFPNGGPQSWADFWDVKKFPGPRSLPASMANRVLAYALMADGVPHDKLYPLDVERAFKKLDEIKPHIDVWWSQGSQAEQLIRDGEVSMIALWNNRAVMMQQQNVPLELVWNDALVSDVVYGMVKGAKNAPLAWEFINYLADAKRQAGFSSYLFYGAGNPEAYKLMTPDVLAALPGSDVHAKMVAFANSEWESVNGSKVTERFTNWRAG